MAKAKNYEAEQSPTVKYATLRGLWRTAQQAESAENLCTRTCRRGRIEERGRSGDYLQCDTADTVTATARTSERRRGTRAESANTKTLTGALLFMESRLQRQTDARKYHLLPSLPSDALRPSLAKPRISILQDASWLPSSWRLGAIGNLSHRGLRGCRLSLLPNWKRAACPPPLSLALRRRTDWRRESERARERQRERPSHVHGCLSLSPPRRPPICSSSSSSSASLLYLPTRASDCFTGSGRPLFHVVCSTIHYPLPLLPFAPKARMPRTSYPLAWYL